MSVILFKEVKSADKATNTRLNGLWGVMARFVSQEPAKSFNHEELKDYLKNREKEAREEDRKWKPSGAYRSNKSLIIRATRLGVSLMNRSTFRGKTEVQDTCNELERRDNSPYDQFMASLNTVSKKLDKLEAGQKVTAFAAINELAGRVRKAIEQAAGNITAPSQS